MTTCARTGCDETVVPALDREYCSRACRDLVTIPAAVRPHNWPVTFARFKPARIGVE